MGSATMFADRGCSVDIGAGRSESSTVPCGSKLDFGVGIELVNNGAVDGLPPVSRDETRVPVVSGFVPVNGGGT